MVDDGFDAVHVILVAVLFAPFQHLSVSEYLVEYFLPDLTSELEEIFRSIDVVLLGLVTLERIGWLIQSKSYYEYYLLLLPVCLTFLENSMDI